MRSQNSECSSMEDCGEPTVQKFYTGRNNFIFINIAWSDSHYCKITCPKFNHDKQKWNICIK